MSDQDRGRDGRLSGWKLFAFSLPAIPIAAVGLPLLVHIPPFFASHMGLSLELVGLLFMFARFWDVFTDPVLGIVSDRLETRWGRRRHWIVLSVPLLLLSVYMIFMPVAPVSGTYLVFWLFVLYAGWTLLTISHASWGAELSADYHERNRIQGGREIALVLGAVLVLTLPVFIDLFVTENVEAKRVAVMGWFMIILLPITVWIAVAKVGEKPTIRPKHVPFRKAVGVLLSNKPLRIILIADLFLGISLGMHSGTFLFMVTNVLELGTMSGIFLLCFLISGLLFVPVTIRLSKHWDKHHTTANIMLLNSLLVVPILFMPAGNWWIAFICFTLFGVTSASGSVLFRSMIADVADQDAVETGQQRTGLFFSMMSMTNKIGGAVAIGISYNVLAWIGFDPTGSNAAETLQGVRLTYIVPTIIAGVLVAVLFRRYPLTEELQVHNRKILEQRALDGMAAGLEDVTAQPADPQSSGVPAG